MLRLVALLVASGACTPEVNEKLTSLSLGEESRAALSRLRWRTVRQQERVRPGDAILCGKRDRVALGFSRKLVIDFLGRDSDWLLAELFASDNGEEVLLTVPPQQLMRLQLPRGIDGSGSHPDAWVREVAGYPLATSDLRQITALFAADTVQELFALREDGATTPHASVRQPAADKPPSEWRLGVHVFPRMGPRNGVMISEVVPGTPAEAAGLQKGDRILTFAGQRVDDFRELKAALQRATTPRVVVQLLKKSNKTNTEVEIDLAR